MKKSVQKFKKPFFLFRIASLITAGLLVLTPVTGFGAVGIVAANAVDYALDDVSLSTFTVGGQDVLGVTNPVVTIAKGSTSVEVIAVANSDFADNPVITGDNNLHTGSNTVSVYVLAEDQETSATYTVTVNVAEPSSDKTLSSVLINSAAFTVAEDGSSVYQAGLGTTQLSVVATPNSNLAQVDVTGNTSLNVGSNNTVTIHVTAEDLTTKDYSFHVNVASANTNTNLSTFTINGTAVQDNETIVVPYGTNAVSLSAITSAETSTYTTTGDSGLALGSNTVSVIVTAQSGAVFTHSVTVSVAAPSSDRAIDSVTVNGVTLVGSSIDVAAGVNQVALAVDLHSNVATYVVTGNTNLIGGSNSVTVTVTSQDGVSSGFIFTVNVYQPSTNTALQSVLLGTTDITSFIDSANAILLPYGTASVNLNVTPADSNSSVSQSGTSSLQTGSNTVLITVTSESGSTTTYSVKFNVAASSDASVSSITVDGV
ncbi:MAG: hypothetical protein WCG32_00415, partial [Actinomycetes bacterium]